MMALEREEKEAKAVKKRNIEWLYIERCEDGVASVTKEHVHHVHCDEEALVWAGRPCNGIDCVVHGGQVANLMAN